MQASVQTVIRESKLANEPAVLAEVTARWGDVVVSRGRVHVLAALPALVAGRENVPLGCLTYSCSGTSLEVVTLDAFVVNEGTGSALMRAAAQRGARVWLITSNDNLSAQRFYVKLGMSLVAVHRGAITQARLLKPSIPMVGANGAPMTDEYEYQWSPVA